MEHEKALLELKQKLVEFLEPQLKEVKVKYKKVEKREGEIYFRVSCLIAHDIFDKSLDDKEIVTFCYTYSYMLYHTSAIKEALSELYSRV